MNLKAIISTSLLNLIFLGLSLHGQSQDYFWIRTRPIEASAYIYNDSEFVGVSNQSFRVNSDKDDMFYICANGYKTINLPRSQLLKHPEIIIALTKAWDSINLDGVEKFMFRGISNQTPNGYSKFRDPLQEYNCNEAIGNKLIELLGNNVYVPNPDFKELKKEKECRFILAGNMEISSISMSGSSSYRKLETGILAKIEWSLFDKRKQEVIYEDIHYGLYYYGFYKIGINSLKNEQIKKGFNESKDESVLLSLEGLLSDEKFLEAFNLKANERHDSINYHTKIYLPAIETPDIKSLEDAVQSVVTIKTNFGFGSGFIISENGYIITNHHVIEGETKVSVKFESGMEIEGKVVRSDKENDIALISIPVRGLKPFKIAAEYKLGEDVFAIGTAASELFSQSITRGIVSGKRDIENITLIQTDVAVNHGNSGGPLINEKFEVIGIVSSKIVGTTVEGIGFAIPCEAAIKKISIELEKK